MSDNKYTKIKVRNTQMRAIIKVVIVLIISSLTPLLADNLDTYWAEASRTVTTGDFKGYAATYHPDAILVNGIKKTSYPISKALSGWKQGFDDVVAGKMKAGVTFRFSETLESEQTAHQTGIFNYYYTDDKGKRIDSYIHFEALLVKKDEWKMMMEYQKSVASIEQWAALKK
jgi:ketosteroid isomerase-like protein